MFANYISAVCVSGVAQKPEQKKRLILTQHVVGHMNLDVPFTVENHLAFDTLVCLLLQIGETEGSNNTLENTIQ